MNYGFIFLIGKKMLLQKIAEMVAKIVLTELIAKVDQAIERQIKVELTINPDHKLEEIAKKAVMEIINDSLLSPPMSLYGEEVPMSKKPIEIPVHAHFPMNVPPIQGK